MSVIDNQDKTEKMIYNYKQMYGTWRNTITSLPKVLKAMMIEVLVYHQTPKSIQNYNAKDFLIDYNLSDNNNQLNLNLKRQNILENLNNPQSVEDYNNNNGKEDEEDIGENYSFKQTYYEKKRQQNSLLFDAEYEAEVLNNKFYKDEKTLDKKYQLEFITEIAISAVDENGNSLCVRVNDWKSWIYIEFYDVTSKDPVKKLLDSIYEDFRYKKYKSLLQSQISYELVHMSRLCGFIPDDLDKTMPKKFPYYKIYIPSKNFIKIIKEHLSTSGCVHQESIAFGSNFLAQTQLKESCWFTINDWQEPDSYISHSQIEILTSYKSLNFNSETKTAPFTIASFDIEAYSGTGMFCTANSKTDSIVCINSILYRENCEIWPNINKLEQCSKETFDKYLKLFSTNLDKSKYGSDKPGMSENLIEELEEEEEDKNSNAVKIMNTKNTRRLCHLFDPTLKKMEKLLIPTKYNEEENPGILVFAFPNALEMMEYWRDCMTIIYQVDLYMGHNLTFDWKFIFDHVNFLSKDNIPYQDLNIDKAKSKEYIDWNLIKPKSRTWYLSKLIYKICPLTILETSSCGRGSKTKAQPSNPLVMTLDTYLLLSEDSSHKYDSYTLNFLSKKILHDSKVDLPPKQINLHFKNHYYKDIVQYCDHDCLLVSALVKTLRLIIVNIALSKVCNTAFSVLTTRGLQIRTWNLLVRECYKKNILFYILKAPSSQSYDGGCVFEPLTGYYDKNVVFTLDFASLYPTVIQDYNLCYSTLFYPKNRPTKETLINWYGEPENLEDPYYNDIKKELRPQITKNTIDLLPSKVVGDCHFVQSYRGVLPSILDDLRSLRTKVKNEMKQMMKDKTKYNNETQSWISPIYEIEYLSLDAEQLAIKLTMNASYGFTGVQDGRLPCHPISESVTYLARTMVTFAKKETEKKFVADNLLVLYGDTDSIMVLAQNILIVIDVIRNLPTIECMTESIELGKRVETYLNATFKIVGFVLMNLVWEKAYTPYLLVGKKNYAGMLWVQPHIYAYMDVKTLGKKRDIYEYIRETMEKMLKTLFIDRRIDLVKEHVIQLFTDMIDEKIDIKKFVATKQLRQFNYGGTSSSNNNATNPNPNNNTKIIPLMIKNIQEEDDDDDDNNDNEEGFDNIEEEEEEVESKKNNNVGKNNANVFTNDMLESAFAMSKRKISIPVHAAANIRYAKDYPGSEFKPGDRIAYFITYSKSKNSAIGDRSIILDHYLKLKQEIDLEKKKKFNMIKIDIPYYIDQTKNQFWKILKFVPDVKINIFTEYTIKAQHKLECIQDINQFFKLESADNYLKKIINDTEMVVESNKKRLFSNANVSAAAASSKQKTKKIKKSEQPSATDKTNSKQQQNKQQQQKQKSKSKSKPLPPSFINFFQINK